MATVRMRPLPSAIRGRERLCFGLKGMASGVTNESRRAGRFLTRLSPTSGNLWVLIASSASVIP